MKVAVGSDHGGLDLKKIVGEVLAAEGIQVIDVGTDSPDSVDYPDYARKVAELVRGGSVDLGILICGTGIGMSIAANKVPGIRAALAWDIFTARMARRHNNANILALGGRTTGPELAREIVKTFVREPFEAGRHEKRVNKIAEIERESHQ
ncbi:MAG: ribose 5-phosphate isomerase B [Deltaproteobacteria bacterium]|nr:ribose 5-phosphate isomerase B [Candidatus Zymogenaceae bacterium]